jgi:hypothetical protein
VGKADEHWAELDKNQQMLESDPIDIAMMNGDEVVFVVGLSVREGIEDDQSEVFDIFLPEKPWHDEGGEPMVEGWLPREHQDSGSNVLRQE